MNIDKLIGYAFAIVVGGMAVKTFKPIIDDYRKRKNNDEDVVEGP